jgi:hypothetical protein
MYTKMKNGKGTQKKVQMMCTNPKWNGRAKKIIKKEQLLCAKP